MKVSISTKPTAANIATVLELLATTVEVLERVPSRFTAAQLRQAPRPGERSMTEVLAHLINCEARSAGAIYLALLVNEPPFADIHPERQLGKLLRFDTFAYAELLAYFRLRRAVLLQVLTALPKESWLRVVHETGRKRPLSVYLWARSLALHELDHFPELGGTPGR
ncbi:MAG: DinB family protein [Anaerolineaceae bacterium]|nr:DinB family protein [Anaerolineaceae bacterium]